MIYQVNLINRDSSGDAQKTDITSNVLMGFSEHTKLDETLDLGMIVINNVTTKDPYTMFDSIQINLDSVEIFNQRISGDTVQLTSKNPLRYSHTITLVEHTKILELFAVSAKTFRNGINTDENFLGDYNVVTAIDDDGTSINYDLLQLNPSAIEDDYYYAYSTITGEYGTYKLDTLFSLFVIPDIRYYIITYVGTTDFTLIGAASNTVGEIFIPDSQGTGSGTCSTWNLIGTARTVYPSSYNLAEVIDDMRVTVPLEMTSILDDYRVFNYTSSSDYYSLFESTESPEFTFKDLTLKECLFNIAEPLDAIPRLKMVETSSPYEYTMELTFDFVNELNDLISSETGNITAQRQQDVDYYATQIESDTINTVNDNMVNEAVETYPANGGWVSPRTDQYFFDFTKSYIPTPKDIYRAVDVKYLMYGFIETASTSGEYGSIATPVFIEISLKNWIVEWNEYRTKSYSARQELLSFEYKNKNIQLGTTFGLFDTVISFQRVLEQGIIDKMIEDGFMTTRGEAGFTWTDETQPTATNTGNNWESGSMLFQVDYISIPKSTRYNIDRQDLSDVDKTSQLVSNQQNRIVNLENFTNNMQGRINRIGNSELSLENRVTDYDDLYNIGDYTSDVYIVTERELVFYNEYIYAKYQLSKNYNMISKFIGVNSENRQWEIAEQNTLQRKLMYKEYVEIDIVEDTGTPTGSDSSKMVTTDGIKCIMDTFNLASAYEETRGGMFESSETTDDLLCDFGSNGGGNSLIFDFQFPSNNFVGNFLEANGTSPTQLANNFVTYVDVFGKMETANIHIYDKLDLVKTVYADYLDLAQEYPITSTSSIDTTYITNDSPFVVMKDSAEEIGGTFQLQFITKDSDSGLGRFLLRKNRLVTGNTPTKYLFYYSSTNQFGRLDTLKIDETKFTKSGSSPTFTFSYTNKTIKVANTSLTSSLTGWAVTDEQGNILVWKNQDGTLKDVITFDFLNKRSGTNYKY